MDIFQIIILSSIIILTSNILLYNPDFLYISAEIQNSSTSFLQTNDEICNNNVDDDGDGLIDAADILDC